MRVARNEQQVVLILGMHRSGTSLVTRLLNLLGLHLGDDLQSAAADNEGGFWEHRFFQMVNMEFLGGFGMNSAGYAPFNELKSVVRKCQGLTLSQLMCDQLNQGIEKDFVSAPVWGFKDPRSVLLWPFWHDFLLSQGWTNLRPVIVFRRPDGCLNSLLRRRDVEPAAIEYGVAQNLFLNQLWFTYNHFLIRSTALNYKPLFLQYEDLLNPRIAPIDVSRMAAHLSSNPEQRQVALDWINPAMNNSKPWPYSQSERATKLEREMSMLVQRQRMAFMKNRSNGSDCWLEEQIKSLS